MPTKPNFQTASPYQDDILALPVADLDAASEWYSCHFGMREVERRDQPCPAVVLERAGVRIGFAINGRDAAQDGAAVHVSNISAFRDELESRGVKTANWRSDLVPASVAPEERVQRLIGGATSAESCTW